MKKCFLFVFCALLLFVVTGCGNKNQVTCTGEMTEDGVTMKAEVIGEFDKDDKLTTVTMIEDLGDKEKADQLCAMYNAFASQMPEGVSVSCSGSKVTIKGYEKMDEDEESDDEKMVGMTKDEFKAAIEKDSEGKVTCK